MALGLGLENDHVVWDLSILSSTPHHLVQEFNYFRRTVVKGNFKLVENSRMIKGIMTCKGGRTDETYGILE